MTTLSAQTIRRLGLVTPCLDRWTNHSISHGLSACGYDLRMEFDSTGRRDERLLFPGEFLLVSSIEKLSLPNNVVGIVHDKSTWARRGICVQNTVAEPGWQGYLTMELTNHGKTAWVLKHGVGIAQIVFHFLDLPTEIPYDGRYQNQARGPVEAL